MDPAISVAAVILFEQFQDAVLKHCILVSETHSPTLVIVAAS